MHSGRHTSHMHEAIAHLGGRASKGKHLRSRLKFHIIDHGHPGIERSSVTAASECLCLNAAGKAVRVPESQDQHVPTLHQLIRALPPVACFHHLWSATLAPAARQASARLHAGPGSKIAPHLKNYQGN